MKPKPIRHRARLRDRLIERWIDWRRRPVAPAEYEGLQVLWPRRYKIPCSYSWVDPLLWSLRRIAPVSVVDLPQDHRAG